MSCCSPGTIHGRSVGSAKRAACPGVLGTLTALKSARKLVKGSGKDRATAVVCWGRGCRVTRPTHPVQEMNWVWKQLIRGAECDSYHEKYWVFWKFRRGSDSDLNDTLLNDQRELGCNLVLPDSVVHLYNPKFRVHSVKAADVIETCPLFCTNNLSYFYQIL